MWHLLFLSSISALVAAGCGDDSCGPGSADEFGLVASDANTLIQFGSLRSSANNDCPDAAAPAGVVSLTISGSQKDGSGLVTLCVPRPDLLAANDLQLGTDLRIIDLTAESMGCTYMLEMLRPVLGTATATGLCDNGTNSAGYALIIDGHLSMTQTCQTSTTTVALSFAGTVAVKPR